MDSDSIVFIVDAAEPARALLTAVLAPVCRSEVFASAEACLERLAREPCVVDLFLLDVDLPGIDGYGLCRRIRERPELAGVPVIFVSALDDLESRLEGYDAGGTDYVVKPYNVVELKQKVVAARRLAAERVSLRDKVAESEMLASLVLSSLDEYALLVGFLRALNDCRQPRAVVDQLVALLRQYRLQAAVQLRLPGFELTVSESGENVPLEVAVINHIRGMDRILQFKSRAALNFACLTVLVNNMPTGDAELCGRLRDHLAIAVECADAKLQALQTKAENAHAKGGVADVVAGLKLTLEDFEKRYALARYRGSSLTLDLLNELASAFTFLAMSDEQEQSIQDIVRGKAEELAAIYDFGGQTQAALNALAHRLNEILTAPAGAAPIGAGGDAARGCAPAQVATAELF